MLLNALLPLLVSVGYATASSILFSGGTVIAFNYTTESLDVIRNGSVLVVDDRITSVFRGDELGGQMIPEGTEQVNITNKIIAPGMIDTHKHGWQTGFKTLASNTSLVEYFNRYGEFPADGLLNADDVYIGQLAGIYEALNSGVTTILDHAHHSWDPATTEAGLQASIDSGSRIFWGYTFHNVTNFTIDEQLVHFRELATNASYGGTPTELAIAFDSFGPNPNLRQVDAIVGLATEFNVSAITTHSLQGPWGYENSPEDLHALNILNLSIPIIFSHASFLTAAGATLLQSTNQFVSITPESEMHYGHTHPHSHLIQSQAALGVDTHFTFSGDILTQARLWLQAVRKILYIQVLDRWHVPANNPMSACQAFLLATRNGGLALRRNDLGVIAEGAKADLVVWDGEAPSLLGWVDPVAAIILHASVGDVRHVVVDGKWKKRDFELVVESEGGYEGVKERFLASARGLQRKLWEKPVFAAAEGGSFPSGYAFEDAVTVDILRGDGDGYGSTFVEVG
ncbi:amidohydrolase [Bombardia bombarda]|uniref:Amidohydrolase n=1 Tax=Bombardia bombarda TaxID=252184 RepID=A0AA39X0S0_9PEZI|nr:amidohydrolase [Bombardia bombarda]